MSRAAEIISEIKNMFRDMRGTDADSVDNSSDFIASLNLESIQVIELVLQIEKRFGIEFGDEPQVLISLDRLAQHIESRLPKDVALPGH